MQSSTKAMALFVATLSVFALSGCSGEPSASDIEKAVKANLEQTAQQAKLGVGARYVDIVLPTVYNIEKLICTAAKEDPGYNCDVEMDISTPIAGRGKSVVKIRFVKGSNGWVVTE